MQSAERLQDAGEEPSMIVRIAYHQLNLMCGIKDLAAPVASSDSQQAPFPNGARMVCMARLFQLPIFTSISTVVSGAYATVKDSHEVATSVLNSTENQLNQAIEYAAPVTDRIANAVETPLKAVDDAVCVGLDFLEEKVPSVKLPPGQMYENISNYVRGIFIPAIGLFGCLFAAMKEQINKLAITSSETTNADDKVTRKSRAGD